MDFTAEMQKGEKRKRGPPVWSEVHLEREERRASCFFFVLLLLLALH
jgi:hypothetical protein